MNRVQLKIAPEVITNLTWKARKFNKTLLRLYISNYAEGIEFKTQRADRDFRV